MRRVTGLVLVVLLCGCGREYYRRSADRDTYAATAEHETDPRWQLPRINVDPAPTSRLYDPTNPDYPPFPPDDPAAYVYVQHPDGQPGSKHWHKWGDSPWIEDPRWRDFLDLDKDGNLVLNSDKSVELGLLNSRLYQTQLENLYLTSLRLTLDRFEFDCHWFFRNNTFYQHSGSSSVPTESNTLTNNTELGFTKAFASGGQLLADLANTYVFEYTGPDNYTVSSNFLFTFTQPLLRQAGRMVRLEALTQGERDVLYAIRDFAHFRRTFSVDLTMQTGFLGLLRALQTIRNQEQNLVSQEQNLHLTEGLFALGQVSVIQIDQAFQSYQNARSQLIVAQASFASAVDNFVFRLGLPPTFKVKLDDSLLDPFQLTDPGLVKLQEDLEKLQTIFRQPAEAPPLEQLAKGFDTLLGQNRELVKYLEQVQDELQRWTDQAKDGMGAESKERGERARDTLKRQISVVREENEDLAKAIPAARAPLAEQTRAEGWAKLKRLLRQQVEIVSEIFVIQNQVRVYLIQLQPVKLDENDAIAFALEERLDLMNQRARVVDAWRKIAVTANALQSDLNVVVEANLGTKANATQPFDFNALNSSYRVGLQFDGPLNREAERNAYRVSLINYQQARRAFMELEDTIKLTIREDLRSLETARLNFEIARQSLVSAARQVESARASLIINQQATGTLDAIQALGSLLSAKSSLIDSWVNYQTLRAQLLRDLEALQLDDRGLYRDDKPIDLDHLRTVRQSTCP